MWGAVGGGDGAADDNFRRLTRYTPDGCVCVPTTVGVDRCVITTVVGSNQLEYPASIN